VVCRVPHPSARPHPKPAGRKSAAERREEPRRSSRGPLCPKGTGPRGRRGQRPRRRRASAPRASSTRSPAVDAEGVTAGRGRPAPGAGRAQPRQRRGRGRSGGGHPRAKRGASIAARQRRGLGGWRARGGEGRAQGGSTANGGAAGNGGKRICVLYRLCFTHRGLGDFARCGEDTAISLLLDFPAHPPIRAGIGHATRDRFLSLASERFFGAGDTRRHLAAGSG